MPRPRLRPRLLLVIVLGLAAIGLAACEEDTLETGEPGIGDLGEPDVDTSDLEETEFDVPDLADANEDRPVVLSLNGITVPTDDVCAGADGAVRVTTAEDVVVTLVREDGTAVRYQAEDVLAETDEVEVDESPDDTVYSATLSDEEVAPMAITMVVHGPSVGTLPAC